MSSLSTNLTSKKAFLTLSALAKEQARQLPPSCLAPATGRSTSLPTMSPCSSFSAPTKALTFSGQANEHQLAPGQGSLCRKEYREALQRLAWEYRQALDLLAREDASSSEPISTTANTPRGSLRRQSSSFSGIKSCRDCRRGIRLHLLQVWCGLWGKIPLPSR